MKTPQLFRKILEYRSRRESLFRLRGMPEKQLEDCGISPALLQQGVKAWPWRATNDDQKLTPLDMKLFSPLEFDQTAIQTRIPTSDQNSVLVEKPSNGAMNMKPNQEAA